MKVDLGWPWPQVKFQIDFSGSKCIWFDAFRRVKHDSVFIFLLALLKLKLFAESYLQTTFTVKMVFHICWPLETKQLTFFLAWFCVVTKGAQYPSDALFGFPLAKMLLEISLIFLKNISFLANESPFFAYDDLSFNPRPDGGGSVENPTPVFRGDRKNDDAQHHRFLHTLSAILFPPFL